MAQVGRGAPGKRGITWRGVCKLAIRLPGVVEGTSYGTPALHVGKRFLARLKEDGETMAIKIDFADREVLLELDPDTFYLTDHYRPYPAVLVHLKRIPVGLLKQVIEQAWRFQAPKNLAAQGIPRKTERTVASRTPTAKLGVRRTKGNGGATSRGPKRVDPADR